MADSKDKSATRRKASVKRQLAKELERVIRGARDGKAKNELLLPEQALPQNLFVVPASAPVVFPTMMAPLTISDPKTIATVEEVLKRDKHVGVLLVKDPEKSSRAVENLYSSGVVVNILKRLKMPDGSINLLVTGVKRFKIQKVFAATPHIVVLPKYIDDQLEETTELDALSRAVMAHVKKIAEVNPFFTEEMRVALLNAPSPGVIADIIAFALALPKEEAQEIYEAVSVKERFEKILVHLRREEEVAGLQRKIQDDVDGTVNSMQREFFLKEQLKAIKKELGVEEDGKSKSAREFREKIETLGMPDKVVKHVKEELEKFETLSEQSPEYTVTRSYLETVCSLPWNSETEDNLNVSRAREILEKDHYGLEKVKERIVEFLAVRKLMKTQKKEFKKGSILCLVGPPGVGKTSIGRSVAETLGRKFYRFSLGGMRDEAEIKGHRRTYIGAMPGKIMQAIRRTESKNPVLMLDEIDKLGHSFQGDPASALLEVLDPEQNSEFLDHYIDAPFDLSKVLFVLTANSVSSIPAPLLDRMEVIELPGYTLEEKAQIATRFVLPRLLKDHGLKKSQLKFEKNALKKMMLDYAREPGLRTLQQLIEKVCRKVATQEVERAESRSRKKKSPVLVKEKELAKWLGPARFYNELAERIQSPGVSVGLAWTAMGGDILFIEAADLPGSGQVKVTGNMGDVMNESASIAWSWVKKRAGKDLKIPASDFMKKDIHLHIPSGGIPKDGPSAGITMSASLYSLLSGRPFKDHLAMTGELSLTGKVLPVGGIKEKVLAAKRAGVKTVLLPKHNQKDFNEIPPNAVKGLKIHFVSAMDDVLNLVLH